jgi:hypothetical protein
MVVRGLLVLIAIVGAVTLLGALAVKPPAVPSQGCDYGPLQALAVQGVHHNLDLVQTNAAREQLTVDDVVVATDRIAVAYHATGVDSTFALDPRSGTEPPTLIHLVVDGQTLAPIDGSTGGEQGMPTMWGEFVGRWNGGTPHHIHISVERIEGDLQAKWEVDADLVVQGDDHRVVRDLGSTNGRDLVIDDVVIGTDRIAVVYHASGIKAVHTFDNSIFAREGATLMTMTADGKSLIRYEDSDSCMAGSSAVRGAMVFRWQGGPVHHLQIWITSIVGDDHATWTTVFDF